MIERIDRERARVVNVESRRWRWYFPGLSKATQDLLYALPDDEWRQFEMRAAVLSHRREERNCGDDFKPPLTSYEAEVLCAMRLMGCEHWANGVPVLPEVE